MITLPILPLQIFGANVENGEATLIQYLESLRNNDYETAYTYLNNSNKHDVPYALFARLQSVNKSIREVLDYKISFKGFEEKNDNLSNTKQNLSVFTIDYALKENLAYSLPYISSTDYSLILEDGKWRILLNQTRREIEEEIEKYNIDQYEDYGKNIASFVTSLDKEIIDRMNKYGVEGCIVALIENNEVVFSKPYGYANMKKRIPVTADTIFNVGSVSKTVSAWGVLKLHEDGLINLDSPAQMYMKRWSFPKSEYDSSKITIRQLLEHRSGLGFSEKRGYEGYSLNSAIPDLVQSLRGDYYPQYAVHQEFPPGEKFEYSNANYTVLQLIIEDVTGISFEEYMQKKLFKPLKMINSTFSVENINDKILATGYDNIGKAFPMYIHSEQASGGLYCTIEDLAQFVITMNQTLSPKEDNTPFLSIQTIKPILEVKTIDYKLGSYIFNSEIAPFLAEHQGHSRGYMALYGTLPEDGSGIVFLTNSDNGKGVMQPFADKWIRWKAGPAKPIFSTLKYTLQKSRDKVENMYILIIIIPTAIICVLSIFMGLDIITKKRKFITPYKLLYSKLNIAIFFLILSITVTWWFVIYDRLFDKISPFPETSVIDLAVALFISALCVFTMLSLLFPVHYVTDNN